MTALSIVPPTTVVVAPLPSPVYVPVHRRALAQRTLPIYTLAELEELASSPLASVARTEAREIIQAHEAASFIFSSHQRKRDLEHLRRKHAAAHRAAETVQGKTYEEQSVHLEIKENGRFQAVLVGPVPLQRRRVPPGRSSANVRRSKAFLDAASWRRSGVTLGA
ncbi:hypothetical protein HMN09_00330000 [Mycena chlorophos]|uniref:Uncharacterized protein n=1 Tax=Mycena chlorophos TaxID=658473 RepID=A0A8H6TJ25_MYCCL|nr:hypothetical protein HMN09_00330000 [Mycena chlorophos]